MARGALLLHPWLRVARLALDLWDVLELIRPAEPGGFDLPDGWEIDCHTGPTPRGPWPRSNSCGAQFTILSPGTLEGNITYNSGVDRWFATYSTPATNSPTGSYTGQVRMRISYPGSAQPELPPLAPLEEAPDLAPGFIELEPAVMPWPALDPNTLPVLKPAPRPLPLPWTVIPHLRPNPLRSPTERSFRGHQRRPVRAPSPARRFQLWPDVQVQPQPHRPPSAPAGSRVRERKVIMAIRGGSVLGRVLNVVTEAKDALDAIFAALPEHCRRGVGTLPHRRVEALWRCWDELDTELALWNLGVEQIEDWVYGRIGQALGEAARVSERPFGLQIGPWDRPPAPRIEDATTLEDLVFELASYFRNTTRS